MAEIFDDVIDETETPVYQATLTDEDGAVVAGGVLTSLVLTWFDRRLGTVNGIVNSRDGQDVLNTNNVTVSGAGLLEWTMQREDLAIIVTPRPMPGRIRIYRATFTGEWLNGSGITRRIVHSRDFKVQVVPGLPAIA